MWKMGSLSTSGIGAYDRIMEVAARWLGRYPNDAARPKSRAASRVLSAGFAISLPIARKGILYVAN